MKILILSDIHGNLSALDAVLKDATSSYSIDYVAILGDLIDYGMRSNEVVKRISSLKIPIICNIWGNHENAIVLNEYSHFSSERGVQSAIQTRNSLSVETINYLNSMQGKNGFFEFKLNGKHFLTVHGSLQDCFWKSISPSWDYCQFNDYTQYDYVLSGHSHIPHVFPIFFDSNNPLYRNKKRTLFINPGSVGQPRNHDARAQYAILDMQGDIYLRGVEYDIEFERSLFSKGIDPFYKNRLLRGV